MAVVVDPKDVDKFLGFANEENLEAIPVAVVTEEPRLVLTWRGKEIVNISRAFRCYRFCPLLSGGGTPDGKVRFFYHRGSPFSFRYHRSRIVLDSRFLLQMISVLKRFLREKSMTVFVMW